MSKGEEMFGKTKICKHKFIIKGYFVLQDKYPRLVQTCKKCGVAVHTPIYWKKQLDDYESQLRNPAPEIEEVENEG